MPRIQKSEPYSTQAEILWNSFRNAWDTKPDPEVIQTQIIGNQQPLKTKIQVKTNLTKFKLLKTNAKA